ncbi:MAG TPA: hypothetical protein VJP02_21090 [Candidatus Sulfotelmatobacter sp.]|nr:hypothetical protein [Candidatus Sulfotelmatobacter sp.]
MHRSELEVTVVARDENGTMLWGEAILRKGVVVESTFIALLGKTFPQLKPWVHTSDGSIITAR